MKIAILGGSTTNHIAKVLRETHEVYEDDFGKFYETAMYGDFHGFAPDFIYIHTTIRNIVYEPNVKDSPNEILRKLDEEYVRFEKMWLKLHEDYGCHIIQNNFEMPFYRLLGNRDCYDIRGKSRFVTKLNELFYNFAFEHEWFHINDINWLSANYGLEKWHNLDHWYMYGYALDVAAIPMLCSNILHIIKSICGENKKAIAIDLDNTLWDGLAGEGTVNVSADNAVGRAFREFQKYIKDLNVPLYVISKNNEDAALSALRTSEGILNECDFPIIIANWDNKANNLLKLSQEVGIAPTDFVFIDDNEAERYLVHEQTGAETPFIGYITERIRELDKQAYFEPTIVTDDDLYRPDMYKANHERESFKGKFLDYGEYLKNLDMIAEIEYVNEHTEKRAVQLIKKTHQFNLTGINVTNLIDDDRITLTAKLKDKFGDNGLVSVISAVCLDDVANIDVWVMSCRVLKRNLEFAVFDKFVDECKSKGIKRILGRFYVTDRNKSNCGIYRKLGFIQCSPTIYELNVEDYVNKNEVIECLNN